MGVLPVSGKTYKELGSDFSWTYQRNEVPEKTSIHKSGETDKIKGITVKVCLPGVRATGIIKS